MPAKPSKNSLLSIAAPLSGEPRPVLQSVEVASYLQIPGFQLIGLPAPEVAESRERVRAAIRAIGLDFPKRRIVLNLSPASVRKRGTGADLAIALAVLQESYQESHEPKGQGLVVAWGELGLDGSLKPAGQLACAVYAAWEAGAQALILPTAEHELARERLLTLRQSGLLPRAFEPRLLAARDLAEAWDWLNRLQAKNGLAEAPEGPAGEGRAMPESREATQEAETAPLPSPPVTALLPISRSLQRVLGVAAAGAHHLLMLGPRGAGKTHALEWLIALQPRPSPSALFHQTLLEELCWLPASGTNGPPVRRISPHVRPAALTGKVTSSGLRPGEFSLAHGGLLLADELPEWARDSRETLREPLESGRVTLTRARRSIELPARFCLAANGNLCPCGGWPREMPYPEGVEEERRPPLCSCGPHTRANYLSRLSGPILDRLDLVVLATAHGTANPGSPDSGAQLQKLREQVALARARTISSWGCPPADLGAAKLETLLRERAPWSEALDALRLPSLRARHKCLRVALSLASWDGLPEPTRASFTEAAHYRPERYGIAS